MPERTEFMTVGQAGQAHPGLQPLLAPLKDETPLSWEILNQRAAPGRPLDTLNACIIILNYLRVND
jgi:hypothetical protein